MNFPSFRIILSFALLAACGHTKPGTHVEVLDEAGDKMYVGGAAASGTSQSVACRAAVVRTVDAIALEFAHANDDVADDVGEALGVSDGRALLRRFARRKALDGAVQDVRFDPSRHICMATVRWKPPLFVKEAVLQAGEALREEELGGGAAAPSGAAPAPSAPAPRAAAAAPAPPPASAPAAAPPPAPQSVAPAPAPAPAAPECRRERAAFARTVKKGRKALDDYEECRRRTSGNETTCHRYKLYYEEAQKKDGGAANVLARCLNGDLPTALLSAVERALPGHAAIAVESRANGNRILWTFSPLDQTAFVLELSASGAVAQKAALAANQVAWVRERLGL